MNDLLKPPADRDLPPRRAARMRAQLLTKARRPRPRRYLLAAAAVLTLIATVTVVLEVRHERTTQILALGPGELDPSLRKAAQRCIDVMAPQPDAGAPQPEFVPVSLADVTIASRQGTWVGVLFLNETGYLGCETQIAFGRVFSVGVGGEAWPHRGWLPGPVQRLSLSSTAADGGSVSVLGRVSARVHRLVLEHGTGRTTTARISGGAFGIISRTDDVRANAELVSYDTAGQEIDRRRLFQPPDVYDHCYTDPAGHVVYGTRGPADCLPADPWSR